MSLTGVKSEKSYLYREARRLTVFWRNPPKKDALAVVCRCIGGTEDSHTEDIRDEIVGEIQ